MPKLRITPADVSISLDGKVRVEGEQARILTNLLIRNHQVAIDSFQKVAPDLQATDIRIDSLGRVEINHKKIAHVARSLAQSQSLKDIGKAVSARVGERTDIAPPDFDVGCGGPNEEGGRTDVFCINEHEDSQGNVTSGLDLVCGTWDTPNGEYPGASPCDHVDLFCTGSA